MDQDTAKLKVPQTLVSPAGQLGCRVRSVHLCQSQNDKLKFKNGDGSRKQFSEHVFDCFLFLQSLKLLGSNHYDNTPTSIRIKSISLFNISALLSVNDHASLCEEF